MEPSSCITGIMFTSVPAGIMYSSLLLMSLSVLCTAKLAGRGSPGSAFSGHIYNGQSPCQPGAGQKKAGG